MIDAQRFLVRSVEREAWLYARRGGVSATQVAHAATPSGFDEVAAARREGREDLSPHVPGYFAAFGTESESEIMRHAHHQYGIIPSDWLIAAEVERRHMGTPDGLNLAHTEIAEAKTTGDPWDGAEQNVKKIPILYRRQVQWNLYVTGAERCLFLWALRVPSDHDWFYMPWLEPRTRWIERDETEIQKLISTADRLLTLDGNF